MRDDLSSRWVGIRHMLHVLVPMFAFLTWQSMTVDGLMTPWLLGVFYLATIMVGAPFKSRQLRRRIYPRAGLGEDGSTLPPPMPKTLP